MAPDSWRWRRRGLIIGSALAILVALLVGVAIWQFAPAASGRAAAANIRPTQPSLRADPAIPDADTLQLVVGGVPRPFSSGESIPIADDVNARVTVTVPDSTPYYRSVDVYLYHENDSSPVVGADIQARVHMLYMDHGTAQPEVIRGDAGHYLAPVQFAMAGEWELDVTITTADGHGAFALSFGIYH